MVVIYKRLVIPFRIAIITMFAATFTPQASAQYQSQQLQQTQQIPQVQSMQQWSQTQASTAPKPPPIQPAGSLVYGYLPTTPQPWPDSGRISAGGTRPIPPGYVLNQKGELVFDPPAGMGFRTYSRSCGATSRWLATCLQEKQSFQMYIRGIGPGIHTRPASIDW